MNVIFLDIDVVTNSVVSTIYNRQRGKSSHNFDGFSPIAVALLRELVSLTDAKIVLSSTWRMFYKDKEHCINIFEANMEKYYGWAEFPIIDMTPEISKYSHLSRGFEIQMWLELHHWTNYVIIDDSTSVLDMQKSNYVHVDYREGFNFATFQKCLNIFGIENHYTAMGDEYKDDNI